MCAARRSSPCARPRGDKDGEIAFFGGSFTAIDRDYMIELLSSAQEFIGENGFKGIRISTRPDAVDGEICDILEKYHVTAVELGAQSTNDKVLAMNRRGHTREDIFRSARLLKERGFELGLQMMTGLYGSNDEDSIGTARDLISLSPDTARIYPAVVIENTELAELYRNGEYRPQTPEEAAVLCAKILPMFERAGIKVIRLGLHSGGGVEALSLPAHIIRLCARCARGIYILILLTEHSPEKKREVHNICRPARSFKSFRTEKMQYRKAQRTRL